MRSIGTPKSTSVSSSCLWLRSKLVGLYWINLKLKRRKTSFPVKIYYIQEGELFFFLPLGVKRIGEKLWVEWNVWKCVLVFHRAQEVQRPRVAMKK